VQRARHPSACVGVACDAGVPEDTAEAVSFLVSKKAKYATGSLRGHRWRVQHLTL